MPPRWILRLSLLVAAGLLLLAHGFRTGRGFWVREDGVDLDYRIEFGDPGQGRLEVELRIDGIDRSAVYLGHASNGLPLSTTGLFRLREARATDGRELSIERVGERWKIRSRGEQMTLRYQVDLRGATLASDFAELLLSRCDGEGARLMGSDVYLFPLSAVPEAIRVRYDLPERWQLVHPFQSGEDEALHPDLRSLYYSAVAAGPYRTLRRQVDDCELLLAVQGDFRLGDVDLVDTIFRVAQQQIRFFGGAPRPRYVFLINPHPLSDDPDRLHYFGLHFDASMIVLLDARTDRGSLQREPAQICAHEFFHNWNGELIGQKGYEMNWFIEGVTTWYAYHSLVEARMLDLGSYAKLVRERTTRDYLEHPLRGSMSVAEAGETVLQDGEVTRLLYGGGMALAIALDAAIDEATQHDRSMDDLLRTLVLRARIEGDFLLTREILEEELRLLTGEDFAPWLDRHVYGTEAPALPGYLLAAG